MAFKLFPKPPGKSKPGGRPAPDVKPKAAPANRAELRPASARDLAASVKERATAPKVGAVAPEITDTGPPSIIEWTPSLHQNLEVAVGNSGLCAVLENAALLYANGQAPQAREILQQGVAEDHDAKGSQLAWLALFDLLQRAGDRQAFDQLALQYVVAFERSAPAWEDGGAPSRQGARPAAGGYIGLTGKLSAAHAPQIANLHSASKKQPQIRLDLGSVTGADDAGAKLLADALAKLRKSRYPLAVLHPEKICRALEVSVAHGRGADEGHWILMLELLQWQNDHKVFEDRAIEYAVAFEVSPPSWEPPAGMPLANVASGAASTSATENAETLVWQGTLTGSSDTQLAKLNMFREGRHSVPIDMTAVERVDFVCAGALFNAIARAESQRKSVQIIGASPIIRALLLLIGISPHNFIKKAM
ncbi:MAG: STAS domain-containing protein [Betaproteobacteria bacterium]|nr:MAG: STAS domain-containing protein [Betaproteobacteria bacterium]